MSTATLLARAEQDFLSAEVLLEKSFYEASVSRAYYAMFYAAEALLLSKGLAASTHKGVLTQVNKHFVKPGVLADRFGKMISRAAAKRQLADYADDFVILEAEAASTLRDARAFIDEIRTLLG